MSTHNNFAAAWEEGFATLSHSSLLRVEQTVFPAEGHDFSSNDTLGLRTHPALVAAAARAGEECGSGSGASRAVLRFDRQLVQFEAEFSTWLGHSSGMLFSTGFLANVALLQAIPATPLGASLDVTYFVDHRAHASLICGARWSGRPVVFFKHGNIAHLKEQLLRNPCRFPVVVVEALHSMDGTWENLWELTELAEATGCVFVLDEAHSAGIVGPEGRGWCAAHPQFQSHCIAVMLGCGKAYGAQGGFVAGSRQLREQLVQFAKPFLYSTGVSPLLVGALNAAWELVRSAWGDTQRGRLLKLQKVWTEETHFPAPSPVLAWPLISSENALVTASQLSEAGFLVRAIRPPTVPRNTARLRIVLRAPQSENVVRELAHLLKKIV